MLSPPVKYFDLTTGVATAASAEDEENESNATRESRTEVTAARA